MNAPILQGFFSRKNKRSYFLLYLTILFLPNLANGQTYPVGFSQLLVTASISDPTALVFAPSSDGRIFVTEQGGKLRVIKNGVLLSAEAVQIAVNSDGERGLIGVVLDPDFTNNQYIYLYHTLNSPLKNRISRYTMDGDLVIPGSEVTVLDLDPLSSATNHNGGAMAFGPDGKLYVGVGENANGANAQNLDTYLGKILRINPDGSVPSGNPYTTGSAQKQRVWSYGLRNPYTIAFQPGSGKLFVNDVGETTWEEINDATASGQNFGWPNAEGVSTNIAYANPVYAYGHGSGDGLGCAITGGTFFNPSTTAYPEAYEGTYFLMDLCGKWINNIDPTASAPLRSAFAIDLAGSALSLQTGPEGNLYYLSRTDGALYKIIYSDPTSRVKASSDLISATYPQPASEVVHFDLKKEIANSSVTAVDLFGNAIPLIHHVENLSISINVASLPAGFYALMIGNSSEMETRKISVIR